MNRTANIRYRTPPCQDPDALFPDFMEKLRDFVVPLFRKPTVLHLMDDGHSSTYSRRRCVGSCVIVSSIIHALVFEDMILDYKDVIGIAKQYDERIVPFVDLAYHEGLDSLCLDDEKSMGYTLRTLGAALWAYWHATSYKEGILKIVLSGGDADTNAAVAGAILGAKFGICHIPEEWRNGLLYASMLHDKVQNFYAMYR